MKTVLIIDDEKSIRKFLKVGLEAEKYKVIEASKGEEGLMLASSYRPDIIILDLTLPDLDGKIVLTKLRDWYQGSVLILSANHHENDKVELLDSGADDYLTKPFGMMELLARLRVIQRHRHQSPQEQVQQYNCASINLDTKNHTVEVNHHPIKLTQTEYQLLTLFLQNEGKLLTQIYILKEIWKTTNPEQLHYTRIYVAQLRKKIAEFDSTHEYIHTEPGIGYRFSPQLK